MELLCRMCFQVKKLKMSHIIPSSYFRSLKNGNNSGQLVLVSTDEKTPPKISNSDPKERLLCHDCEQFLSGRYEQYGTRLLRDPKSTKKFDTYVLVKNFRYKTFYLYLLSILWRASVSEIVYPEIKLGDELNNLILYHIKNNTLRTGSGFRIDHFLKISVFRLTDLSGSIPDSTIKKIIMNIGTESGEQPEDGAIFYFMADGFLIVFYINAEKSIQIQLTKKIFAQLKNTQSIKIPIHDIKEFKQINDGFNSISKHASLENKK
ncbi:MAG: hypothetical protein E6Q75_16855 [Rheinheimera sp.]|nr:MAG: hypothetical protein E6Q75_16855 [Rheinheimera sp.]